MGGTLRDISVRFYELTSKKHEVAHIAFRNHCEEELKCERLELDITNDEIYFVPSTEGYSLANKKIQLWAQASEVKEWDGSYPLHYSVERGLYYIRRIDKRSRDIREFGKIIGEPVNYTKHYGPRSKNHIPYKENTNREESTMENGINKNDNALINSIKMFKNALYLTRDLALDSVIAGDNEKAALFAKCAKELENEIAIRFPREVK